jgi:hypothetical protein
VLSSIRMCAAIWRGPDVAMESEVKLAILSWYAYAESGAAAEAGGWASAQSQEVIDRRDGDLSDPERVVELFNDARTLDSDLTPQGWKYLWSHYGLQGLIDLARRGDWPESVGDEEVADALVRESLAAGYDPVSGQFGELDDQTQCFELIEA